MKKVQYFVKKYLENRPAFLAMIRSQEAILFQKGQQFFQQPVLDFGCGDGFFAGLVFGKNKIAVGLDIANSRIKEAKKERTYKKIVTYDGKKIPYKNNYFQTVISNCVFEHLPNLNLSLQEIFRVLKPEGYLITTVMTDNWNKYLFGKKIFGQWYVDFMRKQQQHTNLLSEKQWINKFKKNNYKIIKKNGYLDNNQAQKLDLWHYLSLPSLLTYKLLGQWIIFPRFTKQIYSTKITKIVLSKPRSKQNCALFFVLQKKG